MMMVLKVRASGSTPYMVQIQGYHAILHALRIRPQGITSGGHACHLSKIHTISAAMAQKTDTALCFEMTMLKPGRHVA